MDARLIEEQLLLPLDNPAGLELRKRSAPAGVQNPRDADLLVDGILEAVAGA